jgi:hypothetical protein
MSRSRPAGPPTPHWMGRHPEHLDLAGGDLDHQQHIQPFEQHGVHGEEVHRQHTLGLGAEAPPPRERRPLGRRGDTAAVQDGPDGAGPKRGSEPAQLTVDAAVPSSGSPWPAAAPDRGALPPRLDDHAGGVGPPAPDQVAVPSSSVVGCTNRPCHTQRGSSRASPASTARSAQSKRGRATRRRSTATSCRNTSSSASLVAERRASSTSHPSSLQKIRYISRRVIHRSSAPAPPPANPQLRAYGRLSGTHRATAKVERSSQRGNGERTQGRERPAERGGDFNEPPPF